MAENDLPPSHDFDAPQEPEWHRMIAESAYYRAHKPEFARESALEHWLAAEEEIRLFLAGVSTGAIGLPAPPKREPEPEQTPPKLSRARVAEGSAAKSATTKRQARQSGKDAEKKGGANTPARK